MPSLTPRIGLLFAFFLTLLVLASFRAVQLSILKGPSLSDAARAQSSISATTRPRRGAIMDRNGVPLAVSRPAADVIALPQKMRDHAANAERLARSLGSTPDEILGRLREPASTVYLARSVTPTVAARVRARHIDGIAIVPAYRRLYPWGWLASQVLGTVDVDDRGASGLELAADRILRGTNGSGELVQASSGYSMTLRATVRSKPGVDVHLTLDAGLERRIEAVLKDMGKVSSPKAATAIVMDARSNTVLAMANWPRVNANDVAGAPAYASRNRAISFTFQPGSTSDPLAVAGALEDRVPADDRVFQDVAQVVGRLGSARVGRWMRAFGFGFPTGVGLVGEAAGSVTRPGPTVAVTPLQLAVAYSAIAGDGVLRRPQLVQQTRRLADHRIISAQVASRIRDLLGSDRGKQIGIPGYTVAGRSSAPGAVASTPSSGSVGAFAGFAPLRAPKLVVVVVVDGRSSASSAPEAAAAFRKMMSLSLRHLHVPRA
jgi:cell division protein FtsI (penicillin-binding protein 3)